VVLLAGLLGGAVAVLVLAPAIALFLPALGLRTVVAPAVVVTLLALALLPAAEQVFPARDAPPRRWASALVPLTVLVAAGATAATGLAVDRFDAAHPVPSQLVYALDADTGHAWWASTEQRPGAFTSRYVHGRTPLPVAFPLLAGQDLATGPAYPAQLLPPALGSVQDRVVGDRRELSLRVVPRRPDRLLVVDLEVPGGKVTAARVAGTPAAASSLGAGHLELVVDAPSRDGVEVLVTVQGGAAPSLRLSDGSDGLDGLPGYTPRPPGVAAAGTHTSDLVLVTGTVPLP
jgi:hypothetical protein